MANYKYGKLDHFMGHQEEDRKYKNSVSIQLDKGKVINIIEIAIRNLICFQTDEKKIHIYNKSLKEKMLVISDNLILQSLKFNTVTSSFYTTHFNNYLQVWLLEETSTDYTKDQKITICKQEQMVLAFEFVMNQTVLATFDSGGQLKVFEMSTFKLLAQFYKMFKKTSTILIVELHYGYFALIGNRMYIYNIERRNFKLKEIKQANCSSQMNPAERQKQMFPSIDLHLKDQMLQKSKQAVNNLMEYVRKSRKQSLKKQQTIKQMNQKMMMNEIFENTNKRLNSHVTIYQSNEKNYAQNSGNLFNFDIQNEINNITQKQQLQHQLKAEAHSREKGKYNIEQMRDEINESPINKIRKLLQSDHMRSLYSQFVKIDKQGEGFEDLLNPQKKIFPVQILSVKTRKALAKEGEREQYRLLLLQKQKEFKRKQKKLQQQFLQHKDLDYLTYFSCQHQNSQFKSPNLTEKNQILNTIPERQTNYSSCETQLLPQTENSILLRKERDSLKKSMFKTLYQESKLHQLSPLKRDLFNQLLSTTKSESCLINTSRNNQSISKTWISNKTRILQKYLEQETISMPLLSKPNKLKQEILEKEIPILPPETQVQKIHLGLNKEGQAHLKKTREYFQRAQQAIKYLEMENKLNNI